MAHAQTWLAQYHDTCSDCGGHIAPNDEVVWIAGEISHAQCDEAVDPDENRESCKKCWTLLPLTGVCDCE